MKVMMIIMMVTLMMLPSLMMMILKDKDLPLKVWVLSGKLEHLASLNLLLALLLWLRVRSLFLKLRVCSLSLKLVLFQVES